MRGDCHGHAAGGSKPAPEPRFVLPQVLTHAQPPALPPHNPQVSYGDDLEHLIRVAAAAGFNSTENFAGAVDYDTLVIGFAFSDDTASAFLRSRRAFRPQSLLARRRLGLDANHKGTLERLAIDTEWPSAEILYAPSARQMLQLAADIRRRVTPGSGAALGARHLLAAFLMRNPGEHAEELRRCGLGRRWTAWAFLEFAQQGANQEDWQSLYPWPLRFLPRRVRTLLFTLGRQ